MADDICGDRNEITLKYSSGATACYFCSLWYSRYYKLSNISTDVLKYSEKNAL